MTHVTDGVVSWCKVRPMYNVNSKSFTSFVDAIAAAKAAGAPVIEAATGLTRWTPATKKAAKAVRHVLVTDDGREVEFSRVRR